MKASFIWRSVAGFIYPKVCPGCGYPLQSSEENLCIQCIYSLPKTGFNPEIFNPVHAIFRGRWMPGLACSWLYFRSKGIARNMMHELKYKGNRELGIKLGRLYANDLLLSGLHKVPDLLTCVPLHPSKLWQ